MSLDTIKKTTEVTQATHDNLNLNANIQVGNVDAAGGNPVPISGTVTANAGTNLNTSLLALEAGGNLAAAAASLSVLDDWDESDRGKVNTIVGQAGVQGNTGTVSANTQRVVLATDVALPAGTNGIGKLTANSGIDIGDVDVTSVVPGTAATNLGKAEDAAHASGDTGLLLLAVRNLNGATTFTDTNGDYSPISVSANGSLYLASVIPGTTATELGKAEDLASASGDTGVMALAKRLDTPVANANVNADADYLPMITDNLGKLWTATTQTEDAGHTSGDRGSFILGVRNTSNTTGTSADRDYAPISTDLWDAPISGMRRQSTTLTAINTTYDDSPTTATSATVDASMFRMGIFVAEVTESGTATDITFTLQMSPDGTTWHDYRVGPWVKYRFDDGTIAAHTSNTLKICEPFMIECSNIRMLVTCTGTDASNSFTVANAKFELQN